MFSSVRSRLASAARWLAPSAACACTGALAGGALEGAGIGGAEAIAVATGFLAMITLPALFVGSVAVRGVYRLWQPDALLAELVEDGGGAPRLAAWFAYLHLAAVALAWAMFQGTWLLYAWTAFKPLTIGFVQPVLTVGATAVLAALSRPVVRLLAAIARRLDRRWRRREGRRSLLRPRILVAGAAAVVLATAYLAWRITVRPRIGPLDTSSLHGPAAALVATGIAHAVWNRARRRARAIAGGLATVLAIGTLAIAARSAYTSPSLTLEIWGAQPIAGLAIERVFDLDAIRSHVSLTAIRPADRPGAAHPDIVLVTIDTVRADRTPPYGGPAEMPVLRQLGERGTVFHRAFAPSNVTRRSIPSMILGLHPTRVRGRVIGWALRVDPRHVLLAERLRAGGYETAGFMCCKGFWGKEARTGLQRGLETVVIEQDGMKLAQEARNWLDDRERRPGSRPLFLWMHIIEPHNWTSGGGSMKDEFEKRRAYDRTLTRSDSIMAHVVGAFAQRAPDRAPILIVTADHGEGLGDHGAPYHSTDLYNSNIHVPFVVAGPGIKAQRVVETVSLTDLMPTIVELAGFEPPAGRSIDGRSLADLAQGRRTGDPESGIAFAAMIKDRSNPGGITAIVQGGWKLIVNGDARELYDLHGDFQEKANVIEQKPDIAEALQKLLDEREALGSAFE